MTRVWLWRWLPALLAILLGALMGAGGYTFVYAKGFSYLSNDPTTCVNCHIMEDQYDGWQKAGHHAVATCNDCHVPHNFVGKWMTKAENGWAHSYAFTTNDFHEPIQMRGVSRQIVEDNCRHCHGELTYQITLEQTHGGSNDMSCLHCHEAVGHGPLK